MVVDHIFILLELSQLGPGEAHISYLSPNGRKNVGIVCRYVQPLLENGGDILARTYNPSGS